MSLACATVERERPAAPPWADPSLGISASDQATLREVPLRLGLARRNEASTCRAAEAALAGERVMSAVLAANPGPEKRAALDALAAKVRGLRVEPPASVRVDWPALAEAAGPRQGAVITWGAWASPEPPWRSGPCPRPEAVEPWLRRLAKATEPACLPAILGERARARWESTVDAGCWCTADRTAVDRLGEIARGIPGFTAGADRLASARLDAACP